LICIKRALVAAQASAEPGKIRASTRIQYCGGVHNMADSILTVNAGSSSIKFALFDVRRESLARLAVGQVERIGRGARFRVRDGSGRSLPGDAEAISAGDHDGALDSILAWIERFQPDVRLLAAGHRVVHGGAERAAPEVIDAELLRELARFEPLAPHHQPHNLRAIRVLAARSPDLVQVACYDTAFHASLPPVARRLPLPRRYAQEGVIRYGFHGLSYEHVTRTLPELSGGPLPRRLVVAHLGNGCSAAAIRNGRSVATTMGFSTLDGLMMATRAGALDPGVILHLMHTYGLAEAELTDLLYNRCGLLGVSGLSGDMRDLLASQDPAAAEAIELFCHRAVRELGALIAVLGGLEALVFTGGIGERAAPIRKRILDDLAWLGIECEEEANERHGPRLTTASSRVAAWSIVADEEQVIARHTLAKLRIRS
jgi:acetate kinase